MKKTQYNRGATHNDLNLISFLLGMLTMTIVASFLDCTRPHALQEEISWRQYVEAHENLKVQRQVDQVSEEAQERINKILGRQGR